MTDSKAAQAARNAADRRLRHANESQWRSFMVEEFAARGLTWNPRPSAAEREAQRKADEQARSKERILREAAKAGLVVTIDEATEAEAAVLANPHVSEAIAKTFDGTAETVKVERAWKDMTEEERQAVAGIRAPRSDAEEAAAWGEPTQYDVNNPDSEVDYRH